jgi:hypothetical protein
MIMDMVSTDTSSMVLTASPAALQRIEAARASEHQAEAALQRADAEKDALVAELNALAAEPPAKGKKKADPREAELNEKIGEIERTRATAKQAFLAAKAARRSAQEDADKERQVAFAKIQSERNVRMAAAYARAYQDAFEQSTGTLDQIVRDKRREARARAWRARKSKLPAAFRGSFADHDLPSSGPVLLLKQQLASQFTRISALFRAWDVCHGLPLCVNSAPRGAHCPLPQPTWHGLPLCVNSAPRGAHCPLPQPTWHGLPLCVNSAPRGAHCPLPQPTWHGLPLCVNSAPRGASAHSARENDSTSDLDRLASAGRFLCLSRGGGVVPPTHRFRPGESRPLDRSDGAEAGAGRAADPLRGRPRQDALRRDRRRPQWLHRLRRAVRGAESSRGPPAGARPGRIGGRGGWWRGRGLGPWLGRPVAASPQGAEPQRHR